MIWGCRRSAKFYLLSVAILGTFKEGESTTATTAMPAVVPAAGTAMTAAVTTAAAITIIRTRGASAHPQREARSSDELEVCSSDDDCSSKPGMKCGKCFDALSTGFSDSETNSKLTCADLATNDFCDHSQHGDAIKKACPASCNADCKRCGYQHLFKCWDGFAIYGTTEMRLSNGKREGTGYTHAECEAECATNMDCVTFIHGPGNGYCELWSKGQNYGAGSQYRHCQKGEVTSKVGSTSLCPPWKNDCGNSAKPGAKVGDVCALPCMPSKGSVAGSARWCPTTTADQSGGDGTLWGWCAEECWQAYLPDFSSCSGYSSVGYTCVDNYCSAMSPAGNPSGCATNMGERMQVDPDTGKCYAPCWATGNCTSTTTSTTTTATTTTATTTTTTEAECWKTGNCTSTITTTTITATSTTTTTYAGPECVDEPVCDVCKCFGGKPTVTCDTSKVLPCPQHWAGVGGICMVDITSPHVVRIRNGSFDGLILGRDGWNNCGQLTISSPNLQFLESGAFRGSYAGYYLITGTKIAELGAGVFDNINPRFQRLTIGTIEIRSNKNLKTLKKGIFDPVLRYGSISFSDNFGLFAVERGALNVDVISMYIYNNAIAVYGEGMFEGLRTRGDGVSIRTNSRKSIAGKCDNCNPITIRKGAFAGASGKIIISEPFLANIEEGAFGTTLAKLSIKSSSVNCCGLEWLIKDKVLANSDWTYKMLCSTPAHMKGMELARVSKVGNREWNPDTVLVNGELICNCQNDTLMVEGIDANGVPICVEQCGVGFGRRFDEPTNDFCDRCRFHHLVTEQPSAGGIDLHCHTCNNGPTVGFPSECTKCTDGYYLKPGHGCVKDCSLDTNSKDHLHFRNAKDTNNSPVCEPCADTIHCNKCPDNPDACTECVGTLNTDYFLNTDGVCKPQCPFQMKPESCDDPNTLRQESENERDFLFRYTPSGGTRTDGILTGSTCVQQVLEDTTRPSATVELSPNVSYTRDSTALLSVSFIDAFSDTVTGMGLDDVVLSGTGRAERIQGVGRVLASDAYMQIEFKEQGEIQIRLPANISRDESCNNNTAAADPVVVVYDIEPPRVTPFVFLAESPDDGVDTVTIAFADTLSPIEINNDFLSYVTIHSVGRTNAKPTVLENTFECVRDATRNQSYVECHFKLRHPKTIPGFAPYRFEVKAGAASDKAGNQSPLLGSDPYHCPDGIPVGANGKCIQFVVNVDKQNARARTSADFTDPDTMGAYVVGERYRISPRNLVEGGTHVSSGHFDNITYTLVDALDGWYVGTKTGEIAGVFKDPTVTTPAAIPEKMTLYAVDAAGQKAKVEEYNFTVVPIPAFNLEHSRTDRESASPEFTVPTEVDFYAVGETIKISPLKIFANTTFSTVAGSPSTLRYAVNGTLPANLFVKTTTGEILVSFSKNDTGRNYSVALDVVDGDERATLETMEMRVKYRDVDDPSRAKCKNGVPYDNEYEFDGEYKCNCSSTFFTGPVCDTEIPRVTSCPDNSTLVDGSCKVFVLHYNTAVRNIKNLGTKTYTDPAAMLGTFYAVNTSYRVAPHMLRNSTTIPSVGNVSQIRYTLAPGAPDNFFLSTTSGEIFWRFEESDAFKNFTVTLNAVDNGGAVQPMETIAMKVRFRDTDVPAYGPNGTCKNGDQIDAAQFDETFTCNCNGTDFEGATCSEMGPNGLPCSNGGRVVDAVAFDGVYSCDCSEGFAGDNCLKDTAALAASQRNLEETQLRIIGIAVGCAAFLVVFGGVFYKYWQQRTAKLDALAALDRARKAYGLPALNRPTKTKDGEHVVDNPTFIGIPNDNEVESGAANPQKGTRTPDSDSDVDVDDSLASDASSDDDFGDFSAAIQIVSGTVVQQDQGENVKQGQQDDASKFVAPMISLGKNTLAAKGLDTLLGVDPKTYMHVKDKVKVMLKEFAKSGTDEDNANIKHLMNGTYKNPPNADGSPLTPDEVSGQSKTIDELMQCSDVQDAGLEWYHVLALRLYTTSSYRSINDPMRQTPPVLPHPFAATLFYISDALSKLREVQGKDPAVRNTTLVFWRGMRDLQVAEEFIRTGGTEMACMSTTSAQSVAEDFASSKSPLLFKFVSKSFMSHGADISFLSVYPGEKEVLYPPLTYLRPIRLYKELIGNTWYQVAEVEPVFPK